MMSASVHDNTSFFDLVLYIKFISVMKDSHKSLKGKYTLEEFLNDRSWQ